MFTYSTKNQTHCQLGHTSSLITSQVVNGGIPNDTILLVDAPPGYRKTTEAIKWAVAAARLGQQVIIAQPTLRRLRQTYRDLGELIQKRYPGSNIIITKIDSTDTKQAVREIVRYFKNAAHNEEEKYRGKILLITNKAFYLCPYIEAPENWHFIMDEPSDIQEFRIARNLRKSAGLVWQEDPELRRVREQYLPGRELDKHLETYFTTRPSAIQGYAQLISPSDDPDATNNPGQIAANKSGDETWEPYRELASKVISPGWMVLVKDDILSNEYEDDTEKKHLIAYPIPLPEACLRFKSATLVGAYFADTLLHRFFTERCGVEFKNHPDICPRLLAPTTDYSMVEFIYPYENKWSKRRRDKDGGVRHLQFVAGVIREMGDTPFLYTTNNDQGKADPFKGLCPKAKLIEGKPHGLNDYENIDNVVVLSAFNPHPDHDRFLQALVGVHGFDVHTAIAKYTILQIVSRCSIRNPENRNPKKIIVPDRMTAIWLAEKYPGSKIRRLHIEPGGGREEVKLGRKRKWESEADRKRAYRGQDAERKRSRDAERKRAKRDAQPR